MDNQPLRVLFLCTGNSARSQMAEALLRQLSHDRIDAVSAGSVPQPHVHPLAIATLKERYSIDPAGLHPKSLDRFLGAHFDYVITVCDRAAESCPVFPGDPERIHWGFDDPAAVLDPEEQRREFERVASGLAARFRIWLALPDIQRRMADVIRA